MSSTRIISIRLLVIKGICTIVVFALAKKIYLSA